MPQINQRSDVNGSNDKPYPQERNFVVSDQTSTVFGPGRTVVTSKDYGDDISIGQVKYARREGAISIYKDVTRNTPNDNAASRKAESSTIFECEEEKTGEEY